MYRALIFVSLISLCSSEGVDDLALREVQKHPGNISLVEADDLALVQLQPAGFDLTQLAGWGCRAQQPKEKGWAMLGSDFMPESLAKWGAQRMLNDQQVKIHQDDLLADAIAWATKKSLGATVRGLTIIKDKALNNPAITTMVTALLVVAYMKQDASVAELFNYARGPLIHDAALGIQALPAAQAGKDGIYAAAEVMKEYPAAWMDIVSGDFATGMEAPDLGGMSAKEAVVNQVVDLGVNVGIPMLKQLSAIASRLNPTKDLTSLGGQVLGPNLCGLWSHAAQGAHVHARTGLAMFALDVLNNAETLMKGFAAGSLFDALHRQSKKASESTALLTDSTMENGAQLVQCGGEGATYDCKVVKADGAFSS